MVSAAQNNSLVQSFDSSVSSVIDFIGTDNNWRCTESSPHQLNYVNSLTDGGPISNSMTKILHVKSSLDAAMTSLASDTSDRFEQLESAVSCRPRISKLQVLSVLTDRTRDAPLECVLLKGVTFKKEEVLFVDRCGTGISAISGKRYGYRICKSMAEVDDVMPSTGRRRTRLRFFMVTLTETDANNVLELRASLNVFATEQNCQIAQMYSPQECATRYQKHIEEYFKSVQMHPQQSKVVVISPHGSQHLLVCTSCENSFSKERQRVICRKCQTVVCRECYLAGKCQTCSTPLVITTATTRNTLGSLSNVFDDKQLQHHSLRSTSESKHGSLSLETEKLADMPVIIIRVKQFHEFIPKLTNEPPNFEDVRSSTPSAVSMPSIG